VIDRGGRGCEGSWIEETVELVVATAGGKRELCGGVGGE
jgi:hypothetical protein